MSNCQSGAILASPCGNPLILCREVRLFHRTRGFRALGQNRFEGFISFLLSCGKQVVKCLDPCYNTNEVRAVQFTPFVRDQSGNRVPVSIEPMSKQDAVQTNFLPKWQTSWTSDFLQEGNFDCYSAKVSDELIALAAYEILADSLVVHIVYMEAHPESNPTLDGGKPKYTGIGQMLIAFGVKLSIDNGLTGDVVLEAKTSALAAHYERDFGAVALPSFTSSAPRFLIADEAAKRIFCNYLT